MSLNSSSVTMATGRACLSSADDKFGPTVDHCRDDFDFTLKFEQCFFVVVPSAAMLLGNIVRFRHVQFRSKKLIDATMSRWSKSATLAIFAALQLALVVLWATASSSLASKAVGTGGAVLAFLAAVLLCVLSPFEHTRTLAPSPVIGAYLAVTLVFDAAILRTFWLSIQDDRLRGVLTASLVLKFVILVLEAQGKRRYVIEPEDKNRSPEEFSGPYARSLLWWLNGLMYRGFKHILQPTDLFPEKSSLRAERLSKRFWGAWSQAPKGYKHVLKSTLLRGFGIRLMIPVLPRLALLGFTMCQPFLLRRLLQFLQDPTERSNPRTGYGLIGAYFVVYCGIAISSSIYWQCALNFLTMLRGTLMSAVFHKTTDVDKAACDDAKSLTLMGADTERVVRGLRDMHELWASIVQIALATWLLKVELGVACVGPLAVTILTVVATLAATPLTTKRQMTWMTAIEARISTTVDVLGSMKSIKITNLGSKIERIIRRLRLGEIQAARSFWVVSTYSSSIALVPQMISPVAAFAIFLAPSIRKADVLDVQRLFTSLSLLILLTQPLFELFAGIVELASALGCLRRIENYLELAPRNDKRCLRRTEIGSEKTAGHREGATSESALILTECDFGWSTEAENVLSQISFQVDKGQLVLLVGPVASGKSTLLKGVLGEVPCSNGAIVLDDDPVAFCDQTPWLSNGTIQENITGDSPVDLMLYRQVVNACALLPDLGELPDGDRTKVGSKGVALSSGQRHRIALARAVYSRHQMLLLDDLFSALDANVKTSVFSNVFGPGGVLRHSCTTVLLATHEVNLLPFADNIICLGSDGRILEQGSFRDLRAAGGYVQELLDNNRINMDIVLPPVSFDVLVEKGCSQDSADVEHASTHNNAEADTSRQLGDMSTYIVYFSCLGWVLSLLFWLLQASYAFLTVFPVVWLKWWADDNTRDPTTPNGQYIGGYAGLQTAAIVFSAILTWFCFCIFAPAAGIELHSRLLRTAIRAPFSLFWTTDTGSIANRFSQDLQLIDGALPVAMMTVVTNLLITFGQAGLIASASAWLLLSFPPVILLLWLVQRCYLRTSRQLRLLDLEEKSPLYTQFMESVDGLATIRAFRWQAAAIDRNHSLVDKAQRPFYLLSMAQKWLALVLDLIVTALAVLVVGVVVASRDTVSLGFSGVSLIQIISITGYLRLLILFWTQLETSLGAVMRIKQFCDSTPDEYLNDSASEVPTDWPATGDISVRKVSVSYRSDSHRALSDVSLDIRSGEKVGICGRTGSGKTTLLLSLLKMVTLESGQITIGNVDAATLPIATLRSGLTAVPDDPFFLEESLRMSIDPSCNATNEQIREALGLVQLKSLSEKDLDAILKPEDLSQGQKQLFALARAILHHNKKVVILDEATSRIDMATDAVIQKVIRDVFSESTVVMIAHRLENILDFDRVAVFDSGRLIEFDKPETLLSRPSSAFRALVDGHRQVNGTSEES